MRRIGGLQLRQRTKGKNLMKHYIIGLFSLVATLLLAPSCSQDKKEPIAPSQPEEEQIYLGIEAEEEALSDARAFGYKLDGTHKRPLINYTEANIPVHAFFKNTQTGALVHATLYFNKIVSENKLRRDFAPVNLNGKYTQASKDHWYVKMFIGVYPEKSGTIAQPAHTANLLTDPAVNQVRVLKTDLWDISTNDNSYSVANDYYGGTAKWTGYNARPLPMATEWTKVSFTKDTGSSQPANSSYQSTSVVFKPLGSVLRIKVKNEGEETMKFNSFSLTGAEPNVAVSSPSALVNEITYTIQGNITPNTDGKTATGGVVERAITDGRVHYHFSSLAEKTIIGSEEKVLLIWLANNPSVSTTQVLRPTFYTAQSANHALVDTTKPYYKVAQRNAQTYRTGWTYRSTITFVGEKIVDLDFGIGQWEDHDGGEVTGTFD